MCRSFTQDPNVRLDLEAIHLKSPTPAQAEALRSTEQKGRLGSQMRLARIALWLAHHVSREHAGSGVFQDEDDLFSSDEEG